jgi:hypothetical protein
VNTSSQIKQRRKFSLSTLKILPMLSVLANRIVSTSSNMLGSAGSLNMCILTKAGSLKQNRGMRIAARLLHQSAHGRSGDAVFLGDLSETHTGAAIMNHLLAVYIEPRSSDRASFQLRPAHSTFDTFNDK